MATNILKTYWMCAFAALLLVACAGTDSPQRQLEPVDAQTSDGTDAGAGEDDARIDDDAGEPDVDTGGPDVVDGEDTGERLCQPNRDGVIERSEVPIRPGLSAKFKVATDATFDTRGSEENGERVWDLAQDLEGDHLTLIELREVNDQWFASEFPDATYATRLSDTEDLLGIFQTTDDALLLLGVVSPEGGLYRTELTYDPPVTVLQFPIEADSTWQTESDVSGRASGAVVVYDESYDNRVDGRGTVRTPFGTFMDAYRIRVKLDRQIGLSTTTVRTYMFVSECFGTIANITSRDNEEDVEFTEASEIRRLAP